MMAAISIALSLVLLSATAASASVAKTADASPICSIVEAGGLHTMRFNLGRVRNETGHWTTTISVMRDHKEVTGMMDLEMVNTVTECNGKKIFHVQGTFHENPPEDPAITVDGRIINKLQFHHKAGTNTYFANDYRTAFRPNDGENFGVVFTKYHLKRNQLFEVQIERPTTKFPYGLGIGLTNNDPNLLAIPDHMNTLKSGTWMYYDRRLFNNGTLVQKDIGRNIDELQKGDQLGIMIKDPGVLHIYINGNDMAPGMAGIPLEVYGVVELRGKTVQVSIIEKHAKLISNS